MGIRYNIYKDEINCKDFFEALMSTFPWNCPYRDTKNTFIIDLFIRVSKYSKASCKIIKSVNYWRNSFKNKKYVYCPSFHIHKLFANRTTQNFKPKIFLNLDNCPDFFIKSKGHDWLIDLFQVTNLHKKKIKEKNR